MPVDNGDLLPVCNAIVASRPLVSTHWHPLSLVPASDASQEGCPWSCGRPVAREMSGKCVASAGALLVETRLEPLGTELESVLGTDALYVPSEF